MSKGGKPYFVLKAANNEVIGTGEELQQRVSSRERHPGRQARGADGEH